MFIEAFSAAQNLNFGEAFITIRDKRGYSGTFDGKPLVLPDGRIQSRFCEFPQFNSVLKGTGVDLNTKFKSLISHYNLDLDIATFRDRIALYSYSKFVLSRFLYGDFNLDYMLRLKNKRFLKDLADSRFSKFLVIFVDSQYKVADYFRFFRSGN